MTNTICSELHLGFWDWNIYQQKREEWPWNSECLISAFW